MAQLFDAGWTCRSRTGSARHSRTSACALGEHDAFWFPAACRPRASRRRLSVEVAPGTLHVTSRRFAQSVAVEGRGVTVDDKLLHLAPGQTRTVAVPPGRARHDPAPHSERTLRFEVPG